MNTHRHILLIRSTEINDWRIMRSPSCTIFDPSCELVENAARSFLRPPTARTLPLKVLAAAGLLFAEMLRIPIRDERRPSGYFWCSVDDRGEFEPGRQLTEAEIYAHVPGAHRPHANCRCEVAPIV